MIKKYISLNFRNKFRSDPQRAAAAVAEQTRNSRDRNAVQRRPPPAVRPPVSRQ